MKCRQIFFLFLVCFHKVEAQVPTAGQLLWLMADSAVYKNNSGSIALPGDLVQLWGDLSGNGNDFFQNNIGQRPLLTYPGTFCTKRAIHFDIGRRTFLASALRSSGAKTIFIVFELPYLAGYSQTLLSIKGTGTTYTEILGTDNASYKPVSYIAEMPGSSTGGLMLPSVGNDISFSPNGNLLTMTYNGGAISSMGSYTANVDAAPAAMNSSGLFGRLLNDSTTIGARAPQQNVSFFGGNIAEIIVYDHILASSEINQVESYLMLKYGLGNLCDPLPVQLIEFTAKPNNQAVDLHWKVADESNIESYILQKRSSTTGWQTFAKLAANSADFPANYSYTDRYPFHGNNYYRILISRHTGTMDYSPERMVDWSGDAILFIYPNPVKNFATIFSPEGAMLELKIFNSSACLVKQLYAMPGQSLDLTDLKNGFYLIRIQTKRMGKTLRFLKQSN